MVGLIGLSNIAIAEVPYESYSEVPEGTPGGEPTGSTATGTTQVRALTFYTDRPTFQAANPGLSLETFAATLVAADNVLACPPPFNEFTNNACFATGGILPGISVELIDNSADPNNVVLTPAFAGVACVAVGPNTFANDSHLDFDPAVKAVGFDLLNPFALQTFNIEIFGPAGPLGTTTADGDVGGGVFFGVESDDIGGITSIVVTHASEGELYCNVEFGGVPVPVELQSFTAE